MKHEKIFLDADLRSVWARLAKKFDAGVAQLAEHPLRKRKVESSMLSTSSTLEPG